MQKMTVRIGKDGKLSVRMEGVKGPDCVVKTEAFRETLGDTVELEYTSEYYEPPETEKEGPASEKLQRE